VSDLNGEAAAAVAGEIGSHAISLALDVTDEAQVAQAFRAAIEQLGPLDIVCANAGVSTMNKVVDLTLRDWDFNMDVNAKGVFLTDREAVRHFLAERRPGVIVNTASMADKIGAPFLAHYVASKFAVVGFTQGLAREVGGDGIRVNAVCPGFVRTGMQDRELVWEGSLRGMTPEQVQDEMVTLTPLGRIEEPEDVADVVAFLASDEARFMTGQAVNVTGGARMD
jgi:NAD(P)-dependent dehydrogenase (short-subunit alcohol dehydrogenase family)